MADCTHHLNALGSDPHVEQVCERLLWDWELVLKWRGKAWAGARSRRGGEGRLARAACQEDADALDLRDRAHDYPLAVLRKLLPVLEGSLDFRERAALSGQALVLDF